MLALDDMLVMAPSTQEKLPATQGTLPSPLCERREEDVKYLPSIWAWQTAVLDSLPCRA